MPGFEFFDEAERNEVNKVLETGILARYGFEGARNSVWKAKELEQELCKTTGAGYTQLVSSGTAALTTALMALGIGAGHEVIMPTFGFVACFEAIVAVGAVPVLVDIDESLTLNPSEVEEAITRKTIAILADHPCGLMAKMDELKAIADKNGLLLVEDASQSFGGKYKGRSLGTIGTAGVFSFDFLDTITCGEGGAVVTNDPNIYKLCDEYSDHGHDHLGVTRHADDHRYMGANYRISELHAAVGLAQIRKLDQILAVQRRNHDLLLSELKNLSTTEFVDVPDPEGNTCSYLSFFLPSGELARQTVAALQGEGLPCAYWYDSKWHYIRKWGHLKNGSWMNRLYNDQKKEILHYSNQAFQVSDAIISRCISVAVSLSWTEAQAKERGEKIAEVINRVVVANTVTT
jgi:8-amino-3,8-dideoxy-alpha-D-manno-octulosonate transaminase